MTHDRDLAEGMDGIDLGGVRHDRNEGVGNALLGAGDARDSHVIALRSANDLKLGHRSPLRRMVGSMTTREEAGIDSAVDFFANE